MNPIQHLLVLAVRVYRWTLSPLKTAVLGPSARCRFTPTCSEYGLEAIQRHGALKGSWLAVKRVCRCHPWGDCGHDPVPDPSGCGLRGGARDGTGQQLSQPIFNAGGSHR